MKIEMAFSLVTEVNTDDFDEAELLARIKADAIIIQTLQATGYRMKYCPDALSFGPDIEEQTRKLQETSQGLINIWKELGDYFNPKSIQ